MPKRAEDAREAVKSFGGEDKAIYFTMGRYDIVSIVEAPNDEAMTKILLARAK